MSNCDRLSSTMPAAGPVARSPRLLPRYSREASARSDRATSNERPATSNQQPATSNQQPVMTFTPRAIGYVRSPYTNTKEIPKGLGAKHDVEGVIEILPEFEAGLTDIEGFSHLFVLWVFDRTDGFELLATPPSDNRTHGVFATRSPQRPNPIGLTVCELL